MDKNCKLPTMPRWNLHPCVSKSASSTSKLVHPMMCNPALKYPLGTISVLSPFITRSLVQCHHVHLHSRTPACLRPHSSFRDSHSKGRIPRSSLLFQPFSWRVHVTFFFFVHVEVLFCHVCFERAIHNASNVASSPLNSLAKNRVDSLFSVVLVSACLHSFFSESNVQIHSFTHSKLCEDGHVPNCSFCEVVSH